MKITKFLLEVISVSILTVFITVFLVDSLGNHQSKYLLKANFHSFVTKDLEKLEASLWQVEYNALKSGNDISKQVKTLYGHASDIAFEKAFVAAFKGDVSETMRLLAKYSKFATKCGKESLQEQFVKVSKISEVLAEETKKIKEIKEAVPVFEVKKG
jgi:hypothetical protein